MKKIASFLMALVFCLMCFGTYGFADFACADDTHEHNNHTVHATDLEGDDEIPEYLFINQKTSTATYNEFTQTLTVMLNIDSESMEKGVQGSLMVSAPYYVLGKPTVIQSNVFGSFNSNYEITTSSTKPNSSAYSYVRFNVQTGASDPGFTQTAYIMLEYPVDAEYIKTYSWLRQVSIVLNGVVTTTSGKSVRFEQNNMTFPTYICNHTSVSERVSVQPTCEKPGETQTYCTVCQYVLSTKETFPKDHDFDFSTPYNQYVYPYVAPTCSSYGNGYFKCKVCGTMKSAMVPKLDHTFGERFLQNGVYYRMCTVCDAKEVASDQCIHDKSAYNLIEVIKPSTCTAQGSAHYRCPSCFQTEKRDLPLADHTYNAQPTIVTAATCTTPGVQRATCSVCKQTVDTAIPALGHAMGEWVDVSAATCVKSGTQARTCTRVNCGYRETRTVQSGGHQYGSWVVTQPSTCVVPGVETRYCNYCDAVQTQPLAIAGHSYGAWTLTKEATCSAAGEENRVCPVCGDIETRPIALVPENHKFGDWTVVTEQTCTADGEESRTCEYCAKVEKKTVSTPGHILGEAVAVDKTFVKTCEKCGYKEITENDKKGTTKTLTSTVGSLILKGEEVNKNYVFEFAIPDMEKVAFYREHQTFQDVYTIKLVDENGKKVLINQSMSVAIDISAALEEYEVSVVRLVGNSLYPVNDIERKDGKIIIAGENVADAEALFLVKGEQRSVNIWIPIVVTIVVLAVFAGAAIFFFTKSKRKF